MSSEIMLTRKIIHVDMDAFFASVEQRDNPQLQGKCLIVGGMPDSRGVVCAASYEARKYGVHSAMASAKAYKLCPHATFLKPQMEKYKNVSIQLREIFHDYTDLIEPLSLDEAYLDVTENKKNIQIATHLAREIKAQILAELSLTASCGVAPNKMLAKIASDYDKPDGLYVIKPDQVQWFMEQLDIGKIPGVGKVTLKKLQSVGIHHCKDVYQLSKPQVIKMFGSFGEQIYDFARGIDHRLVKPSRETKSVGSEVTLAEDTLNLDFLKSALQNEIAQVVKRLRQKSLAGKTITLKVKYHDFVRITRSLTLNHPSNDYDSIVNHCHELLKKTLAGQKKIRLIGLAVSNFDDHEIGRCGQLYFDFY